jgi:hypothetical protein
MLSFLRPGDGQSGNGPHGTAIDTAATTTAGFDLQQQLSAVGVEAKKQLGDVEELIKSWIKTRPALTLGAALATGVLIGWLIKRR